MKGMFLKLSVIIFLVLISGFISKKPVNAVDFANPIEIIENIGIIKNGTFLSTPVGVTLDTTGNIYVADSDNNRIQKYNIGTTTWETFGSSGSGLGQFNGPHSVAVDTTGNIYVADNENHRIQKYNIGTTTWEAFGSNGTALGQFKNPRGVALDTSGNIYVSDSSNNRIQKYNIGTTTWEAFGSYGGHGTAAGQFNWPTGVAVDANGNIYVADSSNHRIQKYNIGTTTWEAFGSEGSAVGQFIGPQGVAVDASGNIYVADSNNHRIQKYNIGTTTWEAMGSYGRGLGQFYNPDDVVIDATGNIYVADAYNNRIQKYNIVTSTWQNFEAFFGSALGEFNEPYDVTIDSTGNIYVADSSNNRIQKYNTTTSTWEAFGSKGSAVGQFDWFEGVDVDSTGNIYVADTSNNRIQKYNIGTTTWETFGSYGSEVGQFNWPTGVAVDSSGNIYVADSDNNRIQKYNIGTTTWETFGSEGSEVGQFNWPTGVAVDSSGNIYVADNSNNRIQKYNTTTSTWEAFGSKGSELGQFDYPYRVTVDFTGNIYVADSDNNRIQKYNIGTTTWEAFGSYGSEVGQFKYPDGLAVDSTGNIYVADTKNSRIQKLVYFVPYTFTYAALSNGSLTGNTSQTLTIGQTGTPVTAVGDSGYAFLQWSDGSTANPRTDIGGTNSVSVTASFTPILTFTYAALSNGSLTGTTSQTLTIGQTGTPVTAVGNSGYTFLEWSDGSTANPRTDIGGTGTLNFTASFTNTRTITDVSTSTIQSDVERGFISIGSTNPATTSNFTFNINYTFVTGSASVVFPAQTVVTPVGSSTVDLTQFTTLDNTLLIKPSLNRTLSSLQIGIPNFNLSFSSPITVTIPVGTNYNNQILQVAHRKENDPTWYLETTCLIVNGNCTFQTTHATTFTVLENQTQSSGNNNNNNNSSSTSNTPDNSCHSSKPVSISDLFQINTTSNTAKIFFTPQADTNDYFISFSSKDKNAEEHGEKVSLLREGVQSHTIYSLKPNTTYYVKVRGQNGCAPGEWSNIMQFKTNSRIYYRYSLFTKSNKSIENKSNTTTKLPIKTTNTSNKKIDTVSLPPTLPLTESPSYSVNPKPVNQQVTSTPASIPKKKCFLWWCW